VISRWMNSQRRQHPILFWFGFMLPLNLILIYAGLIAIAWAVKSGLLR